MYDGGKILAGLIIGVGLLLAPFFYNAGKAAKAPDPKLTEKAKEAETCVAPLAYMTPYHMQLLEDWRNTVVRDGERYYDTGKGTWHLRVVDAVEQVMRKDEKFYKKSKDKVYYKSLQQTCMDCHSNKVDFCDECHNYLGVVPYCWECHIEPPTKTEEKN